MAPITPRLEHSPHKRTRILIRSSSGLSHRAIARKEGIPAGSIHGIILRYDSQISAKSQPRSGRPHSLSERDKRSLFRSINANPFITATQILLNCNLGCSVKTLTRFLKLEGIQHYRALRRPKLTPQHAEKRLQFASQYFNKPSSFWRRWIFSDETTIARGQGEKQEWVFCRQV